MLAVNGVFAYRFHLLNCLINKKDLFFEIENKVACGFTWSNV